MCFISSLIVDADDISAVLLLITFLSFCHINEAFVQYCVPSDFWFLIPIFLMQPSGMIDLVISEKLLLTSECLKTLTQQQTTPSLDFWLGQKPLNTDPLVTIRNDDGLPQEPSKWRRSDESYVKNSPPQAFAVKPAGLSHKNCSSD